MAVSNLTGKDDDLIDKALWLAVRWIDSHPKEQQCEADRNEMQRLLDARCPGAVEMFGFQDDLVRAVRLGWQVRPNTPLNYDEIKAFLGEAEGQTLRGR